MPRPTEYSATEDAIILSTAGMPADVTNRLLEERGFEPRNANAINLRRSRLKRTSVAADDMSVDRLSAYHAELRVRLANLDEMRAATADELGRITRLLQESLDQVAIELGAFRAEEPAPASRQDRAES